jgi:hypothetical protein
MKALSLLKISSAVLALSLTLSTRAADEALSSVPAYSGLTNGTDQILVSKLHSDGKRRFAVVSPNTLQAAVLSGSNNITGNLIGSVSGTGTFSAKALSLFDVRTFGAKGDGVSVTRCTIAAGSKTLSSPNGRFSQSDVGKYVSIAGAGGFGDTNSVWQIEGYLAGSWTNLTSTIVSVESSSSVTIAASSPNGMTNVTAVYGSDDTAGIQSGINYVVTNGGGRLFFPSGVYLLAGPIVDPALDLPCYLPPNYRTNVQYGYHTNSQLFAPHVDWHNNATFSAIPLVFEGACPPHTGEPPFTDTPWDFNCYGSVIWSILPNANGGSMFSCENLTTSAFNGGADYSRKINQLGIAIRNLTIRGPVNPNGNGFDLRGASYGQIENVLIDTGFGFYFPPEPTHVNSFALWLPPVMSSHTDVKNLTIVGWRNPLGMGEHLTGEGILIMSCYNGPNFTNSAGHLNIINGLDIEATHNYLVSGTFPNVFLATMTSENTSISNITWIGPKPLPAWDYPSQSNKPKFLVDPNGALGGRIVYRNASTVGTASTNGSLDVVGVRSMEVVRLVNSSVPIYETVLRALSGVETGGGRFTPADAMIVNGANPTLIVSGTNSTSMSQIAMLSYPGATQNWVIRKRANTDTGDFEIWSSTNSLSENDLRLSISAITGNTRLSGNLDFSGASIGNAGAIITNSGANTMIIGGMSANAAVSQYLKSYSGSLINWKWLKRADTDTSELQLWSSTNAASYNDLRASVNPGTGQWWMGSLKLTNGAVFQASACPVVTGTDVAFWNSNGVQGFWVRASSTNKAW